MFKKISSLKACLLTLSVFLFTGLLQDLAAQSVYLEWVENPLNSMVVNWIDDPGEATSVEYRSAGSSNWSNESGTNRAIPGPTSKRLHTVKLNGLSAGQAYEFRVSGGSDIYKFRTAPASLDTPLKFIVGGDLLDSGSNLPEAKQDFAEVSELAATYDPYFAVIGGDLANANGNPDNVDQWLFLFETWHQMMVTDDGFKIPIVAAIGNNEVPNSFGGDPEDSPFYYTFFRYPQDQWSSKISYGKLDFNQYLSVITLDSDHTQRIPGNQTEWLNNTIQNRDDFRHIVPVYHVTGWPSFKSRTFRGTQEDLVRNNWHKVFRNNRVRLVFEHHDHIFNKTLPIGDCENFDDIRNEKSCDFGDNAKNGTIYMGGGSWGSDNSRTAEKRWYHEEVVDEIHNFVVIEIDNNRQTATAIGENGQVLHEFTDYVNLDAPTALPATNITPTSFTARWEQVEGATNYRIDIATDSSFDNYFRNNKNKSLGDTNEFTIENLNPAQTYYYQVRAENDLTTSQESDDVPVQLVIVDADQSAVTVSQDVVTGDNETTSTITATIIDEDGEIVDNFIVFIFAAEGNLKAIDQSVVTNAEGVAEFQVFNDRAEVVTYGINAGNKELTQKVQVTYIPVSPVALSATNVQNREFTANWELVTDADSYQLDVATDNDFSTIVSEYNSLDVGNNTSYTVENINPGTTYYYRVRAVTGGLVGENSQDIELTTFPDTPVATEPSNISVISFNANWNAAEGANTYRLDVARDADFEQFVSGYEDLDVGNVQSYEVDGLLPGRDYFYRVQSESGPRLSSHSNTAEASTFTIDTENSEIISTQLRVLANGEQSNEIIITIVGDNGDLQEGVTVQLVPGDGSSEVEGIQPETNGEGVARFGVTNVQAENVTYSVIAATTKIGEISVEFIPNEGVLTLGNNFPNPFRFDSSIPLTIPQAMKIKLQVFNSLGSPVRTLVDEELETGYYEIPFNGADLAAGVYFYRLITAEETMTGKMVLVK